MLSSIEESNMNMNIDPRATTVQSLYLSDTYADAIISYGSKTFPIHSCIVAAASPVLSELLATLHNDNHTGEPLHLESHIDIDADTLKRMLQWIYRLDYDDHAESNPVATTEKAEEDMVGHLGNNKTATGPNESNRDDDTKMEEEDKFKDNTSEYGFAPTPGASPVYHDYHQNEVLTHHTGSFAPTPTAETPTCPDYNKEPDMSINNARLLNNARLYALSLHLSIHPLTSLCARKFHDIAARHPYDPCGFIYVVNYVYRMLPRDCPLRRDLLAHAFGAAEMIICGGGKSNDAGESHSSPKSTEKSDAKMESLEFGEFIVELCRLALRKRKAVDDNDVRKRKAVDDDDVVRKRKAEDGDDNVTERDDGENREEKKMKVGSGWAWWIGGERKKAKCTGTRGK